MKYVWQSRTLTTQKEKAMKTTTFFHPQQYYNPIFLWDKTREASLANIVRYSNYTMLYPTNLVSHQHQVAAVTRHLIELFGFNELDIDIVKALIEAFIHDDHEPFMKALDFQSADRAHLNADQKKELEEDEWEAISKVIDAYPSRISGYAYDELLLDAAYHVDTIESQLVKLADKIAGLGEALHEIYAGNDAVEKGTISKRFGKLSVSPIEYYRNYFVGMETRLPLLDRERRLSEYWFTQTYSEDALPIDFYGLWKIALQRYAPDWEIQRLDLQ